MAPPDPRLTPELVVRALAPLLSVTRLRRIEAVLRRRLASVTVVLENLHDPHNGAAALRSCESAGLHHVHVIEEIEPFATHRKVSQNTQKWMAVYHHPDTERCLSTLRSWGFCCLAARPPELDSNQEPELALPGDRPLALVFGNEHMGLSRRALALCHGSFSIPMYGFCESLNLSVSVAVTLQAATRERRSHMGRPGDLGPRETARLRAAYMALSTPYAADVVLRALHGAGS